MRKLNVLVAGSTGYIGVQLINLLVKHSKINVKYLCGNSSVGDNIYKYDQLLKNKRLPKIIRFSKKLLNDVDIIFSALPNGGAQKISKNLLSKNILIDLAADFRLEKASDYLKWYKKKHKAPKLIKRSIYSLPEITGKEIKKFNIIGCPGCYQTSILLPLVPLIKKKLIKLANIIIYSKSGYSGAGRGVHKKYKDKNLYESLSAYGVGFHRHNSEIEQMFKKHSKQKVKFTFTPHLSPMFRGILSTIYVDLNNSVTINTLYKELNRFFMNSKFVNIKKINSLISTNDVINTNNCNISICKTKYKNKVIIISSLDNLIKGGGGQGIQNMNLRFNFPEKMGLNI